MDVHVEDIDNEIQRICCKATLKSKALVTVGDMDKDHSSWFLFE